MMNELEYLLSPEEAAIIESHRKATTNFEKVGKFVEEVARVLPLWVEYLKEPNKMDSYSSFMENFGYILMSDDGVSDGPLVYRALTNAIENSRSLKWKQLETLE